MGKKSLNLQVILFWIFPKTGLIYKRQIIIFFLHFIMSLYKNHKYIFCFLVINNPHEEALHPFQQPRSPKLIGLGNCNFKNGSLNDNAWKNYDSYQCQGLIFIWLNPEKNSGWVLWRGRVFPEKLHLKTNNVYYRWPPSSLSLAKYE